MWAECLISSLLSGSRKKPRRGAKKLVATLALRVISKVQ